MRNVKILLTLTALLLSPTLFANHADENSACGMIAKACKIAGFAKSDDHTAKFWFDCMKPVILGKSVKDVKVDDATVKSCRNYKIETMKSDLEEFEKAAK